MHSIRQSIGLVDSLRTQLSNLEEKMKQALAIDNQFLGSELLTAGEAAQYLRISEWTLRHWVSDRKIRFIKMGRAVRFKRAHLDRFLQDNVHGKEVKSDS
jgi:excisionase family DNA binding protein